MATPEPIAEKKEISLLRMLFQVPCIPDSAHITQAMENIASIQGSFYICNGSLIK